MKKTHITLLFEGIVGYSVLYGCRKSVEGSPMFKNNGGSEEMFQAACNSLGKTSCRHLLARYTESDVHKANTWLDRNPCRKLPHVWEDGE